MVPPACRIAVRCGERRNRISGANPAVVRGKRRDIRRKPVS
jgi:hypothetical protein